MQLRDLTALTLKISGLFLFVLVVSRLPEFWKTYLEQEAMSGGVSVWGYVVPLLVPAVFALVLFTLPYRISDVAIVKNTEDGKNFDYYGLEMIAVRVLGLLLLYWGISDLVYHVSNFLVLRAEVSNAPLAAYNYPYLIATVAELVFAMWLLAGTKSVMVFLRQVRRS